MNGAFEKFDLRAIDYLKSCVEIIKEYHSSKYNEINNQKDILINRFMDTEEHIELFNNTKKHFYNESLADLVKNQKSKNKIN